ncbi:MAG: pyrroloquinoline quinone-dependent dehydrogenase [Gemmatimonadaceae bacterium]|nr:pyrroloquinoline quinone-dependent dehydrogenase [Gemmatimonadaceae bacterium]
MTKGLAVLLAASCAMASCGRTAEPPKAAVVAAAPVDDWQVTGGEPGNSHYSSLDQITLANVKQLQVAWTYHTGDAPAGRSEIQATPIIVGGVMYTTTPTLNVVALRADSGTLVWTFDPFVGRTREAHANRGVVYWTDGTEQRIFVTAARRLFALDAKTGRAIPTFGDSGWVELGAGLGRDVESASIIATSPGVIYHDLLIQGTRVGEGEGSAPGHVRAYDVRTGKLQWSFHTIPQPDEDGYDTWPADAWKTVGGANSWAGMSVDVARGIVYVPTGSATPDFYGGDRSGQTLFANTLLALDAATGKRKWHFQTVHHDIWDRDLPAAPNLLTVMFDGRKVDAVAQITKSGFVFLFDRQTGVPVFPIEERPVPASDLPGETAWPTQPFPTRPAAFARQALTEADLTTLSPASHAAALARFRTLRNDGLFTPPSRKGTIVLPGFDGGGEWGGAAVDRESGVLYVNASDVPWIAALRDTASLGTPTGAPRPGTAVFAAACASCHRSDRTGDGDRVPSLVGIATRRTSEEIRQTLERGKGFMPSFAALMEPEKQALVAYLMGRPAPVVTTDDSPHAAELAASRLRKSKSPYEFVGYERWRTPDGFPAIKPPWGTLSAIDMNTGEYKWRIPLGAYAALTAKGVAPTGTELYGGPIVTAGGLVFIAATQDNRIRAFDKRTGEQVWDAPLPAAGYATPSTYRVNGRQYVVIACGGGKLGSPSGDAYVAFALP